MLDLLSLIFDILLFPIEWGICILFLGFYRGGSLTFEGLFAGFTGGRYGRTLYTYFLNFVRVLLWSLLFIVPGIMKFYSYAMLPYILKDYPDLNAPQVLAMSRKMMDGRRWQLFLLHLSFIGWFLLALLTCGIGLFWLHPYVALSEIAFYENARAEYEAEQGGEAPLQANE